MEGCIKRTWRCTAFPRHTNANLTAPENSLTQTKIKTDFIMFIKLLNVQIHNSTKLVSFK